MQSLEFLRALRIQTLGAAFLARSPRTVVADLPLLLPDDKKSLALLALSLIGGGWLASYVLSFSRMLYDLARPGIPVSGSALVIWKLGIDWG